ncbi:FFLEELY motif protein [Inhella gelatinilytica]|uniref:DUF8198 domain-containing protein n=1 Tax=Inhella gelatinilytica TaxID=2795030 RepID=A0A931NCN6_9BURK|nr:hypothetical protein [Inhella gelatinilytica]MBH9552212.1 hypothetical protein [Inhella gelatinilytica]
MSNARTEAILDALEHVEHQRARRAAHPGLAARTEDLKRFQQARFRQAYQDLLHSPRYAGAAGFFLDELYGPRDYSQRDAQFRRIVRPLVRLFPKEVVTTVQTLAELHALSEELDTEMALALREPANASAYVAAWQQVGRAAHRQAQIQLTLQVGQALDRYTHKPLLRQALRMMRGPAAAAGLEDLQRFLECGFDTFRAMQGADEFLARVQQRETAWAQTLFQGDPGGDLRRLMHPESEALT